MKRLLLFSIILTLCVFAFVPTAQAARFGAGNEYFLEEGEVIRDSLYVGAGTVIIRGTIEDDLIVGGGTVAIDGDVRGDVMVGSGTVNINGNIGDDARVAGGVVTVDGKIGGDLVAAGGTVNLGRDSSIGGDLIAGAGTLRSSGVVNGNAKMSAGDLEIAGTIRGNVEAVMEEEAPRLSSSANIGGNFVYTSEDKAVIEEGAQISGEVTHRLPKVPRRRTERGGLLGVLLGLGLVWKFTFLVAMFITGAVLIALLPKWTKNAAGNISAKPWLSLGWGFLLFIVTPIAALVVAITVIGLPLGLMICALYTAALYMAWIIVGRYAGWQIIRLFRKEREPSPFWSLLLGLVILAIIMLIPILSIFAYFLFVIVGLGAGILAAADSYKAARAEGRV